MNDALEPSYRYCRRVARRAASNLAWAFWLLPADQRRSMDALYAFARECDDLAQRLSMDLDIQALADRDWPGGRRVWPYGAFPDAGGSLAFKIRTAQRCMEAKGYRLVKQPATITPP